MQMEQESFHRSLAVDYQENIIPIFQPTHCQATFWGGINTDELFIRKMPWEDSPPSLAPELNPIERFCYVP